MKNLTRERALELHRQMWSDMQRDLGDYPSRDERCDYKEDWIQAHFPNERVCHSCFLCEYCANQQFPTREDFDYDECVCPIEWPCEKCEAGGVGDMWDTMSISKLLELPEREEKE